MYQDLINYNKMTYQGQKIDDHTLNIMAQNTYANAYEFPVNDGHHKVVPDYALGDHPDINVRRALMNLRAIAHQYHKVIRINQLNFTGIHNSEVEIDYDIMDVIDFRKNILKSKNHERIDNWF